MAELKRIYEETYGMPFPQVENYFRAFFDVNWETREHGAMDGQGSGDAAGTGTAKVMYTRRKHNAKIDPTMNIFSAFSVGMKEQDLLIAFEDLPQDIVRVLNFKENDYEMRFALTKMLGTQTVGNIEHIAKMYSRIMPEVETSTQAASKIANVLTSSAARAILAGRVGTIFKQGTAFFNTLHGVEHIGFSSWMASAARLGTGTAKIKLSEILVRPELASRFKGWGMSEINRALHALDDVKQGNQRLDALSSLPMEALEAVDVKMNALSSVVMYDASYRYHQKQEPNLSHQELDERTMYDVRTALAVKSQPQSWMNRSLTSTQRSVFKAFSFFLGGESVNTFGNFVRLLARKQYAKASAMWFTHGIALQTLTAVYNLITDDEERREKRTLWEYGTGALLGPLAGLPLVGNFFTWGINGVTPQVEKGLQAIGFDVDLPKVYGSSMIPLSDLSRTMSKIARAFDEGTWDDKVIAVNDSLRTLATLVAFSNNNPTSRAGATVQATAYATAAVGNVLDFFVKAGKNVAELMDGD